VALQPQSLLVCRTVLSPSRSTGVNTVGSVLADSRKASLISY